MKVIVVFGSTTGNTEHMAEVIGQKISVDSTEITVKNVTEATAEELLNYDLIVLGSSTWGVGELQDDFIDFNEELASVDLKGYSAAVFGCGDSDGWPDSFCEAVDIIETTLKNSGAEIVNTSIKVDGDVYDADDELELWAQKMI
ncbi:MAG: flavodoxin [Verrucomicrobiota bacterium]|nr:flavodoxin [Verrucomicrobiota bacterium]